MSEEPEATPLRLKRPDAVTPPPAADASAPDSPPPPAESPLIPLPGLPPAANAEAPATPSPFPSTSSPTERIRRRPTLTPDAPPAPAATPDPSETQAPSVKLKVSVRPPPIPPSAIPDAPAIPSPSEIPASGAPLIPIPGLPANLPPSATPPPLPPSQTIPPTGETIPPSATHPPHRTPHIHLRAEAPAEKLEPVPARVAKAAAGKRSVGRDILVFSLVLLLLGGLGAGAYFYLVKPEDAKDAVGDVAEKLGQAAQIPVKKLEDAKDAITSARGKEQARIDALAEGKEPPAERALNTPPPGTFTPARTTSSSTPPSSTGGNVIAIAGEPPTDTPASPAAPQPSPRLLRYADGIRISGVFQGSPARALIDGRIVRQGEVIEPSLGIKFVEVDAETKYLVLEEPTGAQVRVKY